MGALGSQQQRRTQKRTDAGRPAKRENHAEDNGRNKPRRLHPGARPAAEDLERQYAKIVQPKQHDNRPRNQVDRSLVGGQKAADGAGQRPHGGKYQCKAQHKAERPAHSALGRSVTARKVRKINRQHRQQTGRDKRDDAFQK